MRPLGSPFQSMWSILPAAGGKLSVRLVPWYKARYVDGSFRPAGRGFVGWRSYDGIRQAAATPRA